MDSQKLSVAEGSSKSNVSLMHIVGWVRVKAIRQRMEAKRDPLSTLTEKAWDSKLPHLSGRGLESLNKQLAPQTSTGLPPIEAKADTDSIKHITSNKAPSRYLP